MRKSGKLIFIRNIIIYVLALLFAGYLIFGIIEPESQIRVFGFKSYIIASRSMEPVLNKDDAVVVFRVKPENLEVDDIITFKAYIPELDSDVYVTHYLGSIKEFDGTLVFETYGEGDLEFDDWYDRDGDLVQITEMDLVGKAAFKIPKAGVVLRLFQNPLNLLLLGFVIWGSVFVFHVSRSNKQRKIK
jgi:signal peptidase